MNAKQKITSKGIRRYNTYLRNTASSIVYMSIKKGISGIKNIKLSKA